MRVAEFWRRFKNLEGKRYGKRLYTLEDVKIKMFGEWEEAGHFEDHSSGGAAMGLTALLTAHLPDANKSGPPVVVKESLLAIGLLWCDGSDEEKAGIVLQYARLGEQQLVRQVSDDSKVEEGDIHPGEVNQQNINQLEVSGKDNDGGSLQIVEVQDTMGGGDDSLSIVSRNNDKLKTICSNLLEIAIIHEANMVQSQSSAYYAPENQLKLKQNTSDNYRCI